MKNIKVTNKESPRNATNEREFKRIQEVST